MSVCVYEFSVRVVVTGKCVSVYECRKQQTYIQMVQNELTVTEEVTEVSRLRWMEAA